MNSTTLYRLFDRAGRLVYVGISGRGARRLMEHARRSAWWPVVAHATFEHFGERLAALAAERQAIRTEEPLANRWGLGMRPPRAETGLSGLVRALNSDHEMRALAFRVSAPGTIGLLLSHGLSAA